MDVLFYLFSGSVSFIFSTLFFILFKDFISDFYVKNIN